MKRVSIFAGSGILCTVLALQTFGQAPAAPKAAPAAAPKAGETPQAAATRAAAAAADAAFYTAKAKQITDQLHSKEAADNAAGLAELKDWIGSNQKDGAKCFTANLNFMLWDKRYSAALPAMIDSVESAQKDAPYLAKLKIYKGYALIQEGNTTEGNKVVARAFIEYPNESGTVAGTDIINGLKAAKRNNEVMDLALKLVMAKPDNAENVDKMIKMRVSILNGANKETEALAELKRLFNACPMEKTGAMLTSMDQQIRLMHIGSTDTSMLDRFHKEQVEGAAGEPAANKDKEPSFMASLKVSSEGFDSAMEAFDAETFQGAQQRCVLMCLADKGDEALKWAKRAYGQANNPPQVKTATDLIARALKTQDGNVGRAKKWFDSNDPTAKKPAATPVVPAAAAATQTNKQDPK